MNGWEALALAFAGMISLVTGVGWYLLRRLKALERAQEKQNKDDLALAQNQKEAAERERDELRQKIEVLQPLADEVPGLKRQIATMCTQIEDLQDRVTLAEQRDRDKQAEIDRLIRENTALEKQNTVLSTENNRLTIENGAYKQALALIGIERAERESIEQKSDVDEPEPSPEPSEDTTEEKPKEG